MINELRIGNWLQRLDGSRFQVEAKDFELIDNTNDFLKPKRIELSPEILEKAGFVWSIYHQAYHYGDMAFSEFFDLNECYPNGYQLSTFKKSLIIGNSIFYLHQLQNLYFALTGQELTINLK